MQFLSDDTGNRRWIPFEVESIESPRTTPFDYDGIYSQAYSLYKQGFQYWFSPREIQQLAIHNERFETSRSEAELIDLFFRKPKEDEEGECMPVSLAMQLVGGQKAQNLTNQKMGNAFRKLGFRDYRSATARGYIVVRRSPAEMETYRQQLAKAAYAPMTADGMTAVF